MKNNGFGDVLIPAIVFIAIALCVFCGTNYLLKGISKIDTEEKQEKEARVERYNNGLFQGREQTKHRCKTEGDTNMTAKKIREYIREYHEYGFKSSVGSTAGKSYLLPFREADTTDGAVTAIRVEADSLEDAFKRTRDSDLINRIDGTFDKKSAEWFDNNGYTLPVTSGKDITPELIMRTLDKPDIDLHVHLDTYTSRETKPYIEIKNCGIDMEKVLLALAYLRPGNGAEGLILNEENWFRGYGESLKMLECRIDAEMTDEIRRMSFFLDPYDSGMYRLAEKVVETRIINFIRSLSNSDLWNAIDYVNDKAEGTHA